MIQRGRGARFLLEAAQTIGVGGEGRGQHLDGDIAPEPRIARAIHLAHAPGSDEGDDLVRAETAPGANDMLWEVGLYPQSCSAGFSRTVMQALLRSFRERKIAPTDLKNSHE